VPAQPWEFRSWSSLRVRPAQLLSNDPEIVQILDRSAIEGLMEPTNYLGNSGAMVDRVLAGRRD
jgi:adenylosuccinate lyase